MKRVFRITLPIDAAIYLGECQARADAKRVADTLNVETEWSGARRSARMRPVAQTLREMMGDRERCMYCLDSHGSDVEHFWPKTPYPERLFVWLNLLLCCAECGRFKGSRLPLDAYGNPLLIDPTAEDPWDHLDFDPDTGNLTARYDPATASFSVKGGQTVELLHLDEREALAAGHRRSWLRLKMAVEEHLSGRIGCDTLINRLAHDDDYGLLGWCFGGVGATIAPLRDLSDRDPECWQRCLASLRR